MQNSKRLNHDRIDHTHHDINPNLSFSGERSKEIMQTKHNGLRPYDIETVMPRIIAGLNKMAGRPIKSTLIIKILKAEGIRINDQRIRQIIHYMRVNHIIRGLASSPEHGYWIEQDPGKLMECVSDLTGRFRSIKEASDALAEDVVYFSQTTMGRV